MTTTALPATTRAARDRGPLSALVLQIVEAGRRGTWAHEELARLTEQLVGSGTDVLTDDDVQLSLFVLYGLHYGWAGPPGTDLEWDLELLAVRQRLEALHEDRLRALVGEVEVPQPRARAVAGALTDLVAADTGPSLARYVARRATREQALELLALRSVYTLREADAHSWAIPRLTGRPKAALVEIQSDEYGGGRAESMHSALYATAMRGAGLDDGYLAYLDHVPAVVLASHNTMSLLGLQHRLVGALVGHLAAFEMTSSIPNRYFRDGFARLGFGEDVTHYFAEHVEADAVHEQIAAHDLAGALAEQHPALVRDIMVGAAASLVMDGLVGRHVLDAWEGGRSSLRRPLTDEPA